MNYVTYSESYVTPFISGLITFTKWLKHKPYMFNRSEKKYLLSKGLDDYFVGVHKAYRFTTLFFNEAFKRPFYPRELINQCFEVGLKSLALITLTGFIVGIVFTKQSRPPLEDFGATSWLPSLIGICHYQSFGAIGHSTYLCWKGRVGHRRRTGLNESNRAD